MIEIQKKLKGHKKNEQRKKAETTDPPPPKLLKNGLMQDSVENIY
jgi:hypothetical protein